MRKANLRNLGMLVLAGLMLILIPTSAKADFLDFTVDEGTVPGANAGTFVADKLNGGYAEVITFINGTFVTNAYAQFGQYFANEGSDFVTSQLGGVDANGYGLYALFSSDGAVVGNSFYGQNSQFVLYIDPENDTTFALGATGADPVVVGNDGDDYMIMEAYSLSSGFGILVPGIGGFFDLWFNDPTLTADGQEYYPDMPQLFLVANVDGDFDTFTISGTQTLTGDVSAVFQVVPEPGTLALFGIGLVGTAIAIRRRR